MTVIGIAAAIYASLCAGVVLFQICLIAGAPWGHLTQGGQTQGPLTTAGRFAAGVSIVLLTAMAYAVLSYAEVAPAWPAWTAWAAVGIQSLSTVMNWITPSQPERRLWGPVTLIMLVLALFVVVS